MPRRRSQRDYERGLADSRRTLEQDGFRKLHRTNHAIDVLTGGDRLHCEVGFLRREVSAAERERMRTKFVAL